MTGDRDGGTGESSSRDGLGSGSGKASAGSSDDEVEVRISGVAPRSWSAAIPEVCCKDT